MALCLTTEDTSNKKQLTPQFVKKRTTLVLNQNNYVIDFYKRMDQIVVVNPIFIDKLGEYGINPKKVRYIPNFVSKSEFYPKNQVAKNAFRHELGIPLDKFVVFGDGQVQERKGVDDFAKMAKANPDIQFIWAGGFSFGKITDGYLSLIHISEPTRH